MVDFRLTQCPDAPVEKQRLLQAIDIATQPFVLLAIVHISILALRLPLFDRLPGWMFGTRPKSIGPPVMIMASAVLPVVAWAMIKRRVSGRWLVATMILIGFAVQHSLAWSEGRGLAGMRDRIVTTGHAEFASVAVREPSIWLMLTDYQAKLDRQELGRYAWTKPPGQVLFYMTTERVARHFTKNASGEARLEATRTVAALVWPLVSYVVLIPMFFVLRRLSDIHCAKAACLLYLVIPSVALITLHTDQVLFPLLLMTTLALAVEAQARSSWPLAVAAGVSLGVGTFFTFALALAAPLAVAAAIGVAMTSEAALGSGVTPASRYRALARTAGATLIGIGAYFLFLWAVIRYDWFAGLTMARLYNAQWKGWEGGAFQTFYFAWLNSLEFLLWLGAPLALLALGRVKRALLQVAATDLGGLAIPAVAVTIVFLFLAFFGQAKAETARLWLFMVPMSCALAADEIRFRFHSQADVVLGLVVLLQTATVWLTKANMDFW